MPIYDVKVVVEYMYEVEADNAVEAEEQGWHYEDYAYSGEVYSIKVDEQEEDEEDEEDNLDEEVI
jgi:hypothetical protein